MTGRRIGYVRRNPIGGLHVTPSFLDECDQVFEEQISARDTLWPVRDAMCHALQGGDIVYVAAFSHIARNPSDLNAVVNGILRKSAAIRFVDDDIFVGDCDTCDGAIAQRVITALARCERQLWKERQLEGVALAKQRGVYTNLKQKKLTEAQVLDLERRFAQGEPKAKIARSLGVSRETLYKYIRAINNRQ